MLRRDPALCWKYLAELGKACLAARPNAGHEAIAELQKRKPECWVLTQNIDGFHRQAGSPPERLIEIHGELAPLYCQSCGAERRPGGASARPVAAALRRLRWGAAAAGGAVRGNVAGRGDRYPVPRIAQRLRCGAGGGNHRELPYIVEPVLRTRQAGGFTAEVNPGVTDLSERVDVKMTGRALDIMPQVVSHIYR